MKNLGVIVGVTAFIFSSSVLTSNLWAADSSSQRNLLPNLPPWEIVEPPPSEIIYDPPIYLDVDSKGNVYRLNLVKSDSDGYKYSYEVMTAFELDEISSQREIILENMEHRSLPGDSLNAIVQQSSTSTCPLPSNFAIAGNSNGEPVGNVSVLNTYRPVDATTQWIVFDFWTQTFRDRGAHVPI